MLSLITATPHFTFYVSKHKAGGFWELTVNDGSYMIAQADPVEKAVSYIFMVARV